MDCIKSITLDVYNDRGKRMTVFAKEGDTARSLRVTVTANGVPITQKPEAAYFRVEKAGRHYADYPVSVEENGTILVPLKAEAVDCPGRCIADVYLDFGPAGISNAVFDLYVQPRPNGERVNNEDSFGALLAAAKRAEAAAGEAEGHDTSAGEHAAQAEASAGEAKTSASAAAGSAGEAAESAGAANADRLAAESAKLAADAAALLAKSWARGETGSRDGEDQDNSMYYAAQAIAAALQAAKSADDAQRVAQGAVGYYKTPELLRAAHETATDGNWAIVGSTDTIWVWDSDTSDWTDSGNKTDLSQYYTQTEIDEIIAGITPAAFEVTLPARGWVDGAQTVTDARFIDSDNIDYDIHVNGMYVPRDGITITAGQMTVRVDIVPTEDVTIDIRRKEVVAI